MSNTVASFPSMLKARRASVRAPAAPVRGTWIPGTLIPGRAAFLLCHISHLLGFALLVALELLSHGLHAQRGG